MAMVLFQVRLPSKLVSLIDASVEKGFYESKSDFVRDAIRHYVFEKQLASVSLPNNYVSDLKKFKKKQSVLKSDLNKINSL